MNEFPEFQHKPKKKPNYQERVKLGLQRGGLKPISKKQQKKNNEYQKSIIKDKEQPCCKCGTRFNLTRHHYKGRLFITEYIYLCQNCHDFIHSNMNWSMEEGWIWPEYRGLPSNPNQTIPW